MENQISENELNQMTNFEAAITMDDVNESEEKEQGRGVLRRVTLATLTKSSEELYEMCKDNPETTEEMFHLVNNYIEHVKGLLELSQTASTRLLFALLGTDDKEKVDSLTNEWNLAANS